MSLIVLWIAAAVILLVIDMIWLTWLGRGFYVSEIGGLLREKPDLGAAGAFYALYVTGLLVFVLRPAWLAGSVSQALIYGALFGLVAYGTYDLTNLAVLKGFTTRIAIIDMVWGAVLSGVSSALAVWIASHLLRNA
ncbi:MAG: DUF2177 family protein [Hyphomicrobiales bacterium]